MSEGAPDFKEIRVRNIDTKEFRDRIRRLVRLGNIEDGPGLIAYRALIAEIKTQMQQAARRAVAIHTNEHLRERLGFALSDSLADCETNDWNDSREIDRLIDVIFGVIESEPKPDLDYDHSRPETNRRRA